MAKSKNKFSILLLAIVLFVAGCAFGAVGMFEYIVRAEIADIKVYTNGEMSFHFLELGNQYTGDCTYIKAGDVDILIDAGSKVSSISTITKYINRFVEDDTLEYVIVTHAHEDHYAGFATNTSTKSIFDLYTIGTIIDFAQITEDRADSPMYQHYLRERSEAIKRGATHYTALDCVTGANGATDVFDFGNHMTMKILNQRFYAEATKDDENEHSVCTLFTHYENNVLLTGDLESEGEKSLVALNDLPHCKLFKAGHHGSKTSSGSELLARITPEICTVCCCAGNVEYTQNNDTRFPTQSFVDRISVYTDEVYVTTLGKIKYDKTTKKYKNDGFTSMNGNIVVTSKNNMMEVNCSNNNIKLKDTDWFKENRTCPSNWATTN